MDGVRPALASDAGPVFALLQELAHSYEPRRATFDETYARLLTRPDARVAVHVSDGIVNGYVVAWAHPALYANAQVCWVDEICVHPAARRGGVGRALMAEVARWAADAGCRSVTLATGRADAFYESLGYVATARYFKHELTSRGL